MAAARGKRSGRRSALAGLAALALSGCTTAAGLGPNEKRTAVDLSAAPWRSLGMVATDPGGRCTGALVSPRLVLTAAHCLYHPRTAQLVDARQVQFFLAIQIGGNMGQARVASFAAGPGYSVAPGLKPDPSAPTDSDWALLLLDTPVGSPELALPLAAGLPKPGTPLAFGGYQVDRRSGMVADLGCSVTGYGRDPVGRVMMRHSCAATRGASGGPLLAREPGGRWVVVGVGSLAQEGTAGGWAVPTGAILRSMQASAMITQPVAAAPRTE